MNINNKNTRSYRQISMATGFQTIILITKKKKKSQVPVSNESPVFHSTDSEVGDGEHILLGQWEAHVEITFQIGQNSRAHYASVPNATVNQRVQTSKRSRQTFQCHSLGLIYC